VRIVQSLWKAPFTLRPDHHCRRRRLQEQRSTRRTSFHGSVLRPWRRGEFFWYLSYENSKFHTSQAAELNECQYALDAALDICDKGVIENIHGRGTSRQVVIKTDSEHLYLGTTERIFKWETNGWLTTGKTPVVHRPIFRQLQRSIANLEDLCVEVLFWWVPRGRNRDADALASSVLY
jgi:ribonuclease HI